jgi:hypothetical protein
MDPFTLMAMASAAPGVIQALSPQQLPQNALNGTTAINMGAYQPYFNQVLQNGFNPQAQQYQNSSQMANAAMKNNLAGKGTLNSSAGDMALSGLNTNLANSYINNMNQRQSQAMQTVGNFQNGAMQSNIALGQANNQQGWNTFAGNTQNTQNGIGGINSALSGMSGAYGAYMKNQQQMNQQALAQAQYNQYMNYSTNQGGYGNGGGVTYGSNGGASIGGYNTGMGE